MIRESLLPDAAVALPTHPRPCWVQWVGGHLYASTASSAPPSSVLLTRHVRDDVNGYEAAAARY